MPGGTLQTENVLPRTISSEGAVLTVLLVFYQLSLFFAPIFLEGRNFAYTFLPAWIFSAAVLCFAFCKSKIRVSGYILTYLMFSVLCFASVSWSIDPSISFNHAARVGASALVLPGIWFYCSSMPRIKTFLKSYIAVATFALVAGFLFNWPSTERSFLGQSASAIGVLYGMAVVMSFLVYIFDNDKRWLGMVIIFLAPIVITGSLRGLGWSLGVLLVFILFRIGRKVLNLQIVSIAKLSVAGILLLVGVVVFTQYLPTKLHDRVYRNLSTAEQVVKGQDNKQTGAAGTRIVLAKEGISYLRKNQTWFGEGLSASYKIYEREIGLRAYSHTAFIDLVMGVGWVGVILFYSMFFHLITRILIGSRGNGNMRDALVSIICGLLALSLFARVYTIPVYMMMFMIVAAVWRVQIRSNY